MGITKDGIKGEQKLFNLLKKQGFRFFQPDAIGIKNGNYYVFEVKNQERFRPPPFNGHGLPVWQIIARLEYQEKTGTIAVLVIFDKETNEIFWQRFDILDEGECFNTQGNSPRRIYPLTSFKKLKQYRIEH